MRKALVVLAVAVVGATGLYGIAGGLVPDGEGVVHTCYSQANGTWRPIDAPSEQCRRGETQLDLNQEGPQGERGPAGPKGDPGAIDGAPCTLTSGKTGTMSLKWESTGDPTVFKAFITCVVAAQQSPDAPADGTPCDDGNPNTFGDFWFTGQCTYTGRSYYDDDGDGIMNVDEYNCGSDYLDRNSVCP